MASFADWYNQRHRQSGIKFVSPHQQHNGEAVEICRHRAVIYEQARPVTARKDDAAAAVQAAIDNVAGSSSISGGGGGLIHTTSG